MPTSSTSCQPNGQGWPPVPRPAPRARTTATTAAEEHHVARADHAQAFVHHELVEQSLVRAGPFLPVDHELVDQVEDEQDRRR